MQENVDQNRVNLLKIDKDCFVSKEWLSDYVRTAVHICRLHKLTVTSIRMCNSHGKGTHFYIHITPSVDADSANRLQWLLGDDCLRIDFNRARIESGLAQWNKLFERPAVRLRTIYRRKTATAHGRLRSFAAGSA
jgi:hypothetical protein